MNLEHKVVNALLKRLTRILCKIDASQLSKMPQEGPLIVICNHINILEAPILATHMLPRPFNVVSKVETWNYPLYRYLFNIWNGIPLRMGETDREAFRKMQEALAAGRIVGITPEGTRSHNGKMQKGNPGVILLALRTRVPIVPVGYYGSENFSRNIRRLKRTEFNIVVGNPFRLNAREEALSRPVREQMTNEFMYQLSALLPPENRGIYADLSKATSTYLEFNEPGENNLLHALESRENREHILQYV